MTKKESRASEVKYLRYEIGENLKEIQRLADDTPDSANLGTIRAMRNSTVRALLDVRGFAERDRARRESPKSAR